MNIVKHAGVNQALVSLDVNAGCVCLPVSDTGRGFDPSRVSGSAPGHSFGLQNVGDRIATVGGTFVIDSRVEKGTSIALTLPLEKLTESPVFRAGSALQQERIRAGPAESPDEQSVPL
jgi:signal transduction histidine kinase